MSALNINQLAAAAIPVYGAQVPQQGPLAVPVLLDFTQGSQSLFLDFGNRQRTGFFAMCQCLYIDNSGTDQTLLVQIGGGTNQSLLVKGRTQGYYPVCCPNPIQLTFTCVDQTQKTPILMLNFPVAPAQWATI